MLSASGSFLRLTSAWYRGFPNFPTPLLTIHACCFPRESAEARTNVARQHQAEAAARNAAAERRHYQQVGHSLAKAHRMIQFVQAKSPHTKQVGCG